MAWHIPTELCVAIDFQFNCTGLLQLKFVTSSKPIKGFFLLLSIGPTALFNSDFLNVQNMSGDVDAEPRTVITSHVFKPLNNNK